MFVIDLITLAGSREKKIRELTKVHSFQDAVQFMRKHAASLQDIQLSSLVFNHYSEPSWTDLGGNFHRLMMVLED